VLLTNITTIPNAIGISIFSIPDFILFHKQKHNNPMLNRKKKELPRQKSTNEKIFGID
jgi:hypothetical protein